jgi:hypothetical protein
MHNKDNDAPRRESPSTDKLAPKRETVLKDIEEAMFA